jgi:hypothetical protein
VVVALSDRLATPLTGPDPNKVREVENKYFSVPNCSGKGFLLMSKKFTFNYCFWISGAINLYKWCRSPKAVVMDRIGTSSLPVPSVFSHNKTVALLLDT